MRKIFVSLFFVFVFTSNISSSIIQPIWFVNKPDSQVVMYESANTEVEAKEKIILKLERIFDNKISFNDIEILNKEFLHEKVYLKIRYKNENIIQVLSKKTNNFNLHIRYLNENDKYLINTPLYTKLNLVSNHYPKISIKNRYAYYKDEKIFINQNDFYDLLLSKKNDKVELFIDDKIIKEKNYFIEVTNMENKYTSVIQVFSLNDIDLVVQNKQLIPNKNTIMPNFKNSDGLVVSIDERINNNKFMTIVLSCENKIQFDEDVEFSSIIKYANICEFTSKISSIIK